MSELLERFLSDCLDDYLEVLEEKVSKDDEDVDWTAEELEQVRREMECLLDRI
jgi:ubiquinone biosynthesis protein UbiJ